MTTNFLENKICTFKILLSWRFPRKIEFSGYFSSLPPMPSPSKDATFYYYWRLAVSELRRVTIRGAQPSARLSEKIYLSTGPKGPSRTKKHYGIVNY